jgi:hypothetical protein
MCQCEWEVVDGKTAIFWLSLQYLSCVQCDGGVRRKRECVGDNRRMRSDRESPMRRRIQSFGVEQTMNDDVLRRALFRHEGLKCRELWGRGWGAALSHYGGAGSLAIDTLTNLGLASSRHHAWNSLCQALGSWFLPRNTTR